MKVRAAMCEHSAEKDVCDGCQKRPCVCETVVLPSAEKDAPRRRYATVEEGTATVDMADVTAEPCREAVRLLDALWDLYWNGPGSCDYGDHAGYTWAEDQALSDRAEAVEDHYTIHGCRPIPPGAHHPRCTGQHETVMGESACVLSPAEPAEVDWFMCPECKQGKHQNCTGNAWDNEADALVNCECSHG